MKRFMSNTKGVCCFSFIIIGRTLKLTNTICSALYVENTHKSVRCSG